MKRCMACGSTEGFEAKVGEFYCRNCGRTEKVATEYLQAQKQQRLAKFTKQIFFFGVTALVVFAFTYLFLEQPARFDRLIRELGGKAILIAMILGVAFALHTWWSRRK